MEADTEAQEAVTAKEPSDLLEDEQPPEGFDDSMEVQHEEQKDMTDPLRWLTEQESRLQTLSRVTESPIAVEEEPEIRRNVELFNSLQVLLGMVLDDASVFLVTIDKMERERLDILQRWKVLVMTLDNYYHSQLKKMLELHEKLFLHSKTVLSNAESCLNKSERDELGVTETITLWNTLQAAEKSLCGVAEKLESVCKCQKPISVSSPPYALDSGHTTIIIKREQEEQGVSSIQSRLALKVDEFQLQHMTCDGVIGQLKTKSEVLAEAVREKEKMMQPLVEEMEAWLGRVQSLVVMEPVRQYHEVMEQSLPTDEEDEFVEDPEILSDINAVETDEEEEELDRELWKSPSPPLVSDDDDEDLLNPSTLLVQEEDKERIFDEDEEEEQNEEVEDMSKSVDITLGDDEYVEQVTDQIISPSTPVTEWEEERKRMEKEVGYAAKSLPVFSFDSEEKEEIATAKSMEEEEENQEGEEDMEGESNGEEGESNGEEESLVSHEDSHKMDSDYSGSSCRTDEEDSDSLEWVKNISVFSFLVEYSDTAAVDQLTVTEDQEMLSHAALIDQLQLMGSQLEPWSHKKATLVSSPLMVTECDLTRELRLRLDHIVTLWEKLANRIARRIAQLRFEEAQNTLLSWLREIVTNLELLPKCYPPPDEIAKLLENFNSQFGTVTRDGERLLKLVDDAGTDLTTCDPSVKEKLETVTTNLFDAFYAICNKVTDKHDLLADAKDKWEELDSQATPLSEWMSAVESLVSREVYGSSLEDLSHCRMLVEGYQQQLRAKYVMLQKVVKAGSAILPHTQEKTSARHHVDTVVKGLTERWKETEQSLSRVEKVLRHTMIEWREYEELYVAGCDFVSYVREITGEEQLEGSMGDIQLLPKFIHLSAEIKEFKDKHDRFHKVQQSLADNNKAGNTEEMAGNGAKLQSDWTRVCEELAPASLDVLMAEHKEWVRKMVEEMETMVKKGSELLRPELEFVECYPMMTILDKNPSALLGELTSMTNNQAQFTDLEEGIYQIQKDITAREATVAEAASPGPFNSSEGVVEGVISKWEELTGKEIALRPVLMMYSAQLHLASSLHDLLTEATELESFVGRKSDMQAKLTEAKLFSKAVMEDLKQLSYDLDIVYSDQFLLTDHAISLPVSLPAKEEVARINQSLTSHIPALVKRSTDITRQYSQMIALWNEYESLAQGVRESVCEGEEQLNDLKQRAGKGTVLRANPNELLAEAKELVDESQTCQSTVDQFLAIGCKIVENFEAKQVSSEFIQSELSTVKVKWEEFQSTLTIVYDQLQYESDQLNQFLEDLYGFCEQLNDVYMEVVDECCTAVPPRASQEIVARHRQNLEKFLSRYQSLETEYSRLMEAAQHWEEFIVPDQWLQNLRETSPGIGEESCDVFSIRRQMSSSRERLSGMMKLLQEKSHDLELREGNAAVLLDTANELLEWVEQEMEQDMLALRPPAELDKLKSNSASLTSLRQDFETRKNKLEQLKKLVEEARGEVSPAILEKIEKKMAQLMTAWEKMEESVVKTTINTEEVLRLFEVFQEHCSEFEEWLKDGEEQIRVWGLVQADIDRLEEQEPILETLNDEILSHRSRPEELHTEATNIIKLSEQGTTHTVEATCNSLQERFTTMEESCVESRELCEDAKAAMQEYEKKRKVFVVFAEKTKEQYAQQKKKPKRPVGVIQEVLDEHVDFVDEVETQRYTFNDMHEYGQATVIRFLPSEKLQESVSSLLHLWEEFIGDMSTRWGRIVSIQLLWKQYESGVKEILGWISDEAGKFSKEVTTWGGEKGVADHMDTCKMLQKTLLDKKPRVDDLDKMAEELTPEDTAKPNGTSDVGSRLNDMHMHWNSICQLLTETLENLTRVYTKLCTINDITTGEIDWLMELQEMAAQRQVTRGNVELIQNEITRHKGYQTELEDHQPAAEIIEETLPFLLEHSKSCEHDAIKQRVQEFVDMFANVTEMENEYVFKMEKSVPLWVKFNEHKEQLSQWLAGAEDDYNQRLQSGDADLTLRSLRNAEELGEDIAGHHVDVSLLDNLTQQLALLCTSGDKSFLTEMNNQVTERVQTLSKDTEERRELLETRVKSWEVFPVEEAREVKNFVETLESSMTMELDENCSAEELLEQLKHLEELQEQQRVRGGKVAVIDQSADDEEIQKALEKNPDISKERSNLLQGWSRSSSLLSDKLVRLKLRAEMTQQLEASTGSCREAQQCYSSLLNTPLPPSPLLADTHTDTLKQEQSLRKTLENALHNLMESYHRYNNDEQIQIPQRLQEQVLELETRTQELLAQGEQKLINHIPVLLHSWNEFQSQLDELSRCVDMACSELDSLRVFPDFLIEFDALHSRHQMLHDSLQEYEPVQLRLTEETQRHLFGEDPSVVMVQERHRETDRQWCAVVQGTRTLKDEIVPWQQLVDKEVELGEWCHSMKTRVETELAELGKVEGEDEDPTEFKTAFKLISEKLNDREDDMEQFNKTLVDMVTEQDRQLYPRSAGLFYQQSHSTLDCYWSIRKRVGEELGVVDNKSQEWHTRAMKSMRAVPHLEAKLKQREKELARVKRSKQFRFVRRFVYFLLLLATLVFLIIMNYPEARFRLNSFLHRHNIYTVTRVSWTEY